MKRLVAAVLLPAIVAACTTTPVIEEQIVSASYVWGAEVNVVSPCGSKDVFWVSATSFVQGPLREYYQTVVKQPYQAIFITFRGHRHFEVIDGFAESFDGLMHISEVKTMQVALPAGCENAA